MGKILSIITIASLLAACADTHQLIRSDISPDIRLTSSDTIFIAVPQDGFYGTDTYRGSGRNTSQIIYSAFAKHTHLAKVDQSTQSFEAARETANKSGRKYLVYPSILHWEDRATEWSAIPDKVEVKVEVVDVKTGNDVVSVVIKGKSGLATFGGDHPQDLLPEPIEEFVSSLYR